MTRFILPFFLILAPMCGLGASSSFLEGLDRLDALNATDGMDAPKVDNPRFKKVDAKKFERINTEEFVFGVFFLGEDNPRFERSREAREAMDNLRIRLDYPDAWRRYRDGEIEDFSYFGFRLYDMECGLISLEELLSELQEYITKFGR